MAHITLPWLAIEGPIGVGKTTLAHVMANRLGGELVLEQFEENPFLALFYDNPQRYALQTQLYFLIERYDQLTELGPSARPRVSDYMFAKDRIFADMNLGEADLRRYRKVFAALSPQTPPVTHVVYLYSDVDTLLKRIALRSRSYEQAIEADYLARLTAGYDAFFATYSAVPVLRIDTTSLDIVNNEQDRSRLLHAVDAHVAS